MDRFLGPAKVNWRDGWSKDMGHQYTCGYCGTKATPEKFASGFTVDPRGNHVEFGQVRACTHCGQASFFRLDDGFQMPGYVVGREVQHLPEDIRTLYEEARSCVSVGAYNAAAMVCRKIILHVAVEHGLPNPDYGAFKKAVEHIFDNHLMPAPARVWIDVLKDIGNDASHKIELVDSQVAELAIQFCQQMLENVFQNVNLALQYQTANNPLNTPGGPPL